MKYRAMEFYSHFEAHVSWLGLIWWGLEHGGKSRFRSIEEAKDCIAAHQAKRLHKKRVVYRSQS